MAYQHVSMFPTEGQTELIEFRRAGLASAAFADVLITASLVYYLKQSRSHFVTTNNIIDTLVNNVVSTNGVTAVVAIVDTILFAASSTSWHVLPQLTLVKLYFLSLLVSRKCSCSIPASSHSRCFGARPIASPLRSSEDSC